MLPNEPTKKQAPPHDAGGKGYIPGSTYNAPVPPPLPPPVGYVPGSTYTPPLPSPVYGEPPPPPPAPLYAYPVEEQYQTGGEQHLPHYYASEYSPPPVPSELYGGPSTEPMFGGPPNVVMTYYPGDDQRWRIIDPSRSASTYYGGPDIPATMARGMAGHDLDWMVETIYPGTSIPPEMRAVEHIPPSSPVFTGSHPPPPPSAPSLPVTRLAGARGIPATFDTSLLRPATGPQSRSDLLVGMERGRGERHHPRERLRGLYGSGDRRSEKRNNRKDK